MPHSPEALAAELASDPLSLGYAAMSDAEADAALNVPRPEIAIDRDLIASHEVVDATVPSEWAVLTSAERTSSMCQTKSAPTDAMHHCFLRHGFSAFF